MAAAGAAGIGAIALGAACLLGGCSTLGYYAQSAGGHLAVVRASKPVTDWVADATVEPTLRERLALSQRMRDFAVRELALPDNASYRRYANLGRPFVVWNVVAAPELSLTLENWCFVVVGCVAYRGYYDRADADAFAAPLRARGLEVSVYGVPAYSTLGKLPGWDWLADPLLNTFVHWPEGELARLMFHELAHQVAFAPGDTVFNESFATAVERLGGARWLAEQAGDAARSDWERFDARRREFRALAFATRDALAAVYAAPAPEAARRVAKAEVMARLRTDYAALKERWGGFSGYDAWVANANNAALGVMAAYNQQVPAFEALFAREGSDFARFYAAVRRLAALPRAERDAAIARLAPAQSAPTPAKGE